MSDPTEDDGSAFRKAVRNYGKGLASRYRLLHESGHLADLIKGAALDVGVTELGDAGLGKQFIILRQDQLIARLREVPTVYDLFPRRYGVQDRELLTNAFLGEFSQAYQEGEIWKGSVDLQPELGHVDDAMYKTKFNNMKWLERQYIGYLNQEGSDPIKWSMVEWLVLNIGLKLMYEQYERRIRGHYIKPVTGTAGNALFASTGVMHTLLRYVYELKLNPLDNSSYNTYDNASTNMLDAVGYFLAAALAKRSNLDGYALYLNKNHMMWWRQQVRSAYGTHMDFKGTEADTVPDWGTPIKWVPNMGSSTLMILQKPGNLQCLEFVPGEMLGIQFEREMEAVKSWSVWKEGVAAAFVGKKFATLAELVAHDYVLQEIFINKPYTSLAEDATAANAATNNLFRTIANTGATEILDITNAKDGEVYIIEIGSATNPSNITKALKFSTITAAWTPTAVGDYIKLYYDAANSKFYDLERCVGGTRTIVSALQPNIPGATR